MYRQLFGDAGYKFEGVDRYSSSLDCNGRAEPKTTDLDPLFLIVDLYLSTGL